IKQFGGDVDKAIMAYNAGPGNVQNGRAYSFKETKNYLSNVKGYMAGSTGFKQGDISSKEFDRILEESTRVAIEQAKARTQLEVEVSSEVEKIRANLQEKLDEIDAANFSPEKAKELKAEYQARADNDIAIAQQALKTKLDDYAAFKK
ncbi:lytic transglycosylase domain-containing protein, partial [Acinetobacter bohemicus]|uniref:lytic transglycosylase domain-containing protein n=3 Tax=Acinetobacter TaxID=469 RepID=UPI0021D3FAA3